MSNKKIALLGLFIALSFILSYIEMLLPISLGIPGAKIGLANLVIMVALYTLGEKNAAILSLIRVLLVGVTFGNMSMMIYSLGGAALSFIAMLIAKKTGKFSIIGVSVVGGVFHNIGQIIVAAFILETAGLVYYLPFLILVGTVSGIMIGILAGMITRRVIKVFKG